MKHLLVFGSLRKNSERGYNFDRFGKGTQKLIHSFWLRGFEMFSLGSYPAICPSKETKGIQVELHEVDDKAAESIERMEVGAGYTGIKVPISIPDQFAKLGHREIEATIYTWPKERLESGRYPKVESGDWQ